MTPTLRHILAAMTAAGLGLAGLTLGGLPAQAADRVDDVLTSGERLERGDSLVSPSGRYQLRLDSGGALTLVERGNWLTGSTEVGVDLGAGLAHVVLQGDGNLVLVSDDGTVQHDFGTQGTGATSLRLQDDRNLVLFDASGRVAADLSTQRVEVLQVGGSLLSGDSLATGDGSSNLLMQTDGNLVLYRGGIPLWSSGTQGDVGAGAILQADGNLVVYSSADTGRRTLFSTGAVLDPTPVYYVSPYLAVEDRELSVWLAFEDAAAAAVWGSSWTSDRVLPGDELDPGDRRTSRNGRCTLVMQEDDNLVEYCNGRAVFATGSQPTDVPFGYSTAVMQADGNFVVYADSYVIGEPVVAGWNTGIGTPGSAMIVQDDGNIVVQAPDGTRTWSRLTGRLR